MSSDALLARIAAAHTAAFREVTGKWREYQGLVKTGHGGTFFPSDVRVFAEALPRLGLAGRVLEVGSGDGRMLSLLALLRGTACPGIEEVTGVEVVPEYLEVSRRARARLAPELDFSGTREVCANVLEVDLFPFDAVLYFAGGAMPWREEEVFRTALGRELRPEALLVAYGPDAEGFPLRRRGTLPLPGYHTLHLYRGNPGARSAGDDPGRVRVARLGWLAERLIAAPDPARDARGRMALVHILERFSPGASWSLEPASLTVRLPAHGGERVLRWSVPSQPAPPLCGGDPVPCPGSGRSCYSGGGSRLGSTDAQRRPPAGAQEEGDMSKAPERFDSVTALTKANVFFDGGVVSHTLLFPDGKKKTLGLIRPGSYGFDTDKAEVMAIIAGSCRVRLAGEADWKEYAAGSSFFVPAKLHFEIVVDSGLTEYVCSFE